VLPSGAIMPRPNLGPSLGTALAWLDPGRPLRRAPFLLVGAVLMAAKVSLDAALCRRWGVAMTPMFYVDPQASSPFGSEGALDPKMVTIFLFAVPFMAVGVLLTLRRLRDAALPRWLAVLFFVPFAKFLFFAVCAAVPTASAPQVTTVVGVAGGPYREARFVIRPVRNPGVAVLVAGSVGAVVGLGCIGVSVWVLRSYGFLAFLFAPAVTGFTSALVLHAIMERGRGAHVAGAATIAFVLTMGTVVALAAEGLSCMIMATPLLVGAALVGAVVGHAVALSRPRRDLAAPGASALVLLPLSLAAEQAAPVGDVTSAPVESVVVVDAPPDVVWKRVLAFPPLDPPTELVFRAGIAAPVSASIAGSGVGAVRRCEFTTGAFVEPIDTWVEGRELGFSVASQPDPMREQTLWAGPRPPHLDGFLQSTRGQFVLEPLPDGKTRLIGRTFYEVHMAPAWYWRLWSDRMIHAIHMRVLRHVATLAEADVRG
jgi:uncharacterized membrane protein YhaH (DUF805 family)